MADRGRSEAALEAFYAALLSDDAEALYERAPCGYLSTTPDGTIVKVNGTLLTWTGWTSDELVGRKRFVDLLAGGSRIYHETHYATTLQMHGTVREVALDLVTPDGRRLPALVNSVLERSDDGTPLVVRTVVFDATDRRAYERELLLAKQRAEDAEARAVEVARALQRTLLPPALPEIPGIDLDASFQPAGQGADLGGDFYDAVPVGDDGWIVVVGDVCGKGPEATAVTALTRHSLWGAARRARGPRDIVETINHVLLRHHTDRYMTIIAVWLRHEDGRWVATVCAGGHPLPLLVRAGTIAQIGEHGSVVGLFEDPEYREVSHPLEAGDVLVLFTDGITEGRRDGEQFGASRLEATIRHHPVGEGQLAGAILAAALDYQGGSTNDDAAVVTITVGPVPPTG
jgi:sigma-B regulation protein RsbU (phosphoserine phosphatase)